MVTNPTVLILGAGASSPYRFPIGSALVDEIIRACSHQVLRNSELANYLKELDQEASKAIQFAGDLKESGMFSIDAFLQDRPEYLELGKILIAYQLIPRERPEMIQGDWYQRLFNAICAVPRERAKGKLAILTFNYERSFEFFLRRSAKAKFGLTQREAEKWVSQIEFIYLHGKLGELPSEEKPDGREFSGMMSPDIVYRAAQSLKIIHEPIEDKKFARAKELLDEANTVCFLGFSFHPLNINRIIPPKHFLRARGRLFGTSFNMGKGECKHAEMLFPVKIELRPFKCEQMLREEMVIF